MKKSHNLLLKLLVEYQKKMVGYEDQLRIVKSRKMSKSSNLCDITMVANEISGEVTEENICSMFTAEDRRGLKSIGMLKQSDNTYARALLMVLYRNEMEKLPQRTIRTNSKSKIEMTPKKFEAMKKMMVERAQSISDDIERASRMNPHYTNTAISDALYKCKKLVPEN